MGVLHSFSIKNIFYDKMDLGFFYFDMTKCEPWLLLGICFDFGLKLGDKEK